jgi:formate hydrogenlyase subunit 3/multisubunit Na+/H+ antiporter MnhD subunit
LAGLALLLPMLPLMSYSASPLVLLGLVVVAGLPPTLAFGSRLLALQADVEAGALGAFAAIAGACAYVLLLAAGARAARLPSVTTRESRHAIWPVVILAAGSVVAGAFVGPVLQTFALPVATQVMNVTGQPVSAGFFSVVTDSGTWAAFALAVPALAVVVFLAAARARHVYGVQRHREPPPPFLDLPTFPLVERVRQFRLQPASNPGQELRLPEALTAMPLGVLALLFGLLVFVVTRWSA